MKPFFFLFIFSQLLHTFEVDFSTYYEQLDQEEQSSITSLYTTIKHENIPTDLGIHYNLSATLNTPLLRENNFYDYVEDKATLRGASVDYYHQNMAFSLGRNNINIPLLNGSFDGLVLYKIQKAWSYRFFYFTNYEVLLPTYYTQNSSMDLLGTNINYTQDSLAVKLNLIKNRDDNFLHSSLSYDLDIFTLNFEIANYRSSFYKSESFKKAFVSKQYGSYYFELGYMQNGDRPIEKLIEFDQSELHYFGIGNKTYVPDAKNIYFEFVQEKGRYNLDVLVGYTRYAQTSWATEVDISLSYQVIDNLDFEVHFLREESSEGDTNLISSSLNYRFAL